MRSINASFTPLFPYARFTISDTPPGLSSGEKTEWLKALVLIVLDEQSHMN
jgi:hypothetical protein